MARTPFPSGRPTPGQAIAEFAIILPVMLLMMLIAVDFGRLFFTYIQVNNAAREAANYAAAHAVDLPPNGTATYSEFHDGAAGAGLAEANVQTQAGATTPMAVSSPACFSPGSPPTAIDCADAPEDGTAASGIGNQVSVTVTQQFTFLTPLISAFFSGGLNLSATATATVLNPLVAQVLAPSPSPGASVGPSSGPSSGPSAVPSATPPVNCTIPNFIGSYWNDVGGSTATQVWQNAHFTGTLSGSNKVTSQGAQIATQSRSAGSTVLCTVSMSVDWH